MKLDFMVEGRRAGLFPGEMMLRSLANDVN